MATSKSLASAVFPPTVILRNNVLYVYFIGFCSAACGVGALYLAGRAATNLFPLHTYTSDRVIQILVWLWGTFCAGAVSAMLWKATREAAYFEARLNDEGLHLRLGTRNHPREVQCRWSEITAINYKRKQNIVHYELMSHATTIAVFSRYTYILAEELAREISIRSGRLIR